MSDANSFTLLFFSLVKNILHTFKEAFKQLQNTLSDLVLILNYSVPVVDANVKGIEVFLTFKSGK